MKKYIAVAAVAAAMAVPYAAQAQEIGKIRPYVGASVGYHDLGLGEELDEIVEGTDLESNSGGLIYGGLAGVEFPIGEKMSIAIEGNYHLGSDAIDSEYGAAVLLGYNIGTRGKLFVKGGYQQIDVSIAGMLGVSESDLEDAGFDEDDFSISDGDYLVGVGGEFGIGSHAAIRVGVDTVSFDTVRGNAGVIFKF